MRSFALLVLALGWAFALSPTARAEDASSSDKVLTGKAAFGDWRDDAPGVKRLIRPGDLEAPFVTESASNGADKAKMPAGAKPKVPAGFSVEMVASGLASPRVIRTAPNGD